MNSIEKEKAIHSVKQRKIEEEQYQDALEETQEVDHESLGYPEDWFDGREY